MINKHKQFELAKTYNSLEPTGVLDSPNVYRLDKDLVIKRAYELNEKEFRNSVGQKFGRTEVHGATYSTATSDYLLAVTSLGIAPTIGLPRPKIAGMGKTYVIKDESGGAGSTTITICSMGEETIDGVATATITTNYLSKELYTDGANWFTLKDYLPVSTATEIPMFGTLLTGVSFPRVQGVGLAVGNNDLYTVPTGKKAIVVASLRVYNSSAGNIDFYPELKVDGTYYKLSPTQTLPTVTATNNMAVQNFILEAGEIFAVNVATNNGLNIVTPVVEFDSTAPIATAKILALANGDNTIYTVPASKNAIGIYTGTPTGQVVSVSNNSGAARNYILYKVISGAASGVNYQLQAATATADGNIGTFELRGGMTAGDFIVLNTNSGTTSQTAWTTYLETTV